MSYIFTDDILDSKLNVLQLCENIAVLSRLVFVWSINEWHTHHSYILSNTHVKDREILSFYLENLNVANILAVMKKKQTKNSLHVFTAIGCIASYKTSDRWTLIGLFLAAFE